MFVFEESNSFAKNMKQTEHRLKDILPQNETFLKYFYRYVYHLTY